MEPHWPQRVAIVGVGLIGGSLGMALRERRPDVRVVGVDHDEAALTQARERGAIHEARPSLRDGVANADLVVLATPCAVILEQLPQLPSLLGDDALVTDVGSTKRAICQRGRGALGERFVGGHPMAGSERSGIPAARADLFQGAVWVVAREVERPPRQLTALVEALGAHVMAMTPNRHDRVVAATSHLPQLIAVALGAHLASRASEEDDAYARLIASGGADWLRLAQSSSRLWRDVAATNADHLHDEIQALIEVLQHLDGDLDQLDDAFHRANRLANGTQNGVSWRDPNGGDPAWRSARSNSLTG